MFDLPFDLGPLGPEEEAVAQAATQLRDTIEFVPNGHADVKDYFLDISLMMVFSSGALGATAESTVELLNHLETIVRDVYSRLEVRL